MFKKLFLILILFFILISCQKSPNSSWDVDVVFPIVKSNLNIKNFIGDSLFNSDNTGLLHFNMTKEFFALKLDSLIKIPDTTIVNFFTNPTPFPYLLSPGESLSNLPLNELRFDIGNGVSLKKIIIRKGSLKIKFSNDLTEPLDLEYILNSISKQGTALKISESIPPGTNSLIKTYDLSGYSMDMQGISGNKFNTIVQKYMVSLNANSNAVNVPPGKGAKIEVNYTKITPEYLEGYFGQQKIDIPENSTNFNFSDNFQASNFSLPEASLNFKIINEFGAEFSANLFNVKSINTTENKTIPLITTQLSNLNINRALKAFQTISPSTKEININNLSSNLPAFISNLPNIISYQANVNLNPLGNVSGFNDFAFYNTGIKIIADIDIPMRFNANYFKLKSNSIVDFSNATQLNNLNTANFIISASNGYPFQAKLQVYLIDDKNHIIDSLFNPESNLIEKAQLNSSNEVTAVSKSKLINFISTEKLNNLKKCKTIQVISYLIMPANNQNIKIFESYNLEINIVAEINYKAEIKRN